MSEVSIKAQSLMQIMIEDFCKREYGSEADFGNMEKIPLAYTTSEDGKHTIQAYADIEHLRVQYYYDGFIYGEELYKCEEDMMDFLQTMTFDELVSY